MDKISTDLLQISNKLDEQGKLKCADIIDDILRNRSLHKVAQYVGVIGYVLKQNRAMGNCIRKKRASSSGSMQEVVMGCLSEYQDGQQYGNNEWTSKYAEVIKQAPDKFETTYTDFLEAVAKENKLSEHITVVKEACAKLETEGMKNTIFSDVLDKLAELEQNREGDVDPRPFKLAAPQRGLWSRFWSPDWSRGGKDKDAQNEMDAILQSIMNIQNDSQQIRGGISQLRFQSRSIQDDVAKNTINEIAKSPSKWEQIIGHISNLERMLPQIASTNPDADVMRMQQIIQGINRNADQIYDEMQTVQQNMYNLRLSDAVKGRGTASAADEYGDLNQSLTRLYSNPLDEKALFYSQKSHGRLEDALQMRQNTPDEEYQDWVQQPQDRGEIIDPINYSPTTPTASPASPAAPAPESSGNSYEQIADGFAQITGGRGLENVIQLLKNLQSMDDRVTPQNFQAINALVDALEQKSISTPSLPQPQVQTQTLDPPVNPSVQPDQPNLSAPAAEGSAPWDKPYGNWGPKNNLATLMNRQTLHKIADVVGNFDEDLAKLLSDYFEEQDDKLPVFPETSAILKEHVA